MNAAFHGTVEEQEHCARGLVDTDLNGDAGFLELARQIWQGLIEGVFGIHGATLEGMRAGVIGAALGPPGLAGGELSVGGQREESMLSCSVRKECSPASSRQ